MKELKNFSQYADNDISDAELIGDVVGRYKGMSENELLGELMKSVADGRADGSFSDEKLDDFVALISPELSESQRNKLNEIVSEIKK